MLLRCHCLLFKQARKTPGIRCGPLCFGAQHLHFRRRRRHFLGPGTRLQFVQAEPRLFHGGVGRFEVLGPGARFQLRQEGAREALVRLGRDQMVLLVRGFEPRQYLACRDRVALFRNALQ